MLKDCLPFSVPPQNRSRRKFTNQKPTPVFQLKLQRNFPFVSAPWIIFGFIPTSHMEYHDGFILFHDVSTTGHPVIPNQSQARQPAHLKVVVRLHVLRDVHHSGGQDQLRPGETRPVLGGFRGYAPQHMDT